MRRITTVYLDCKTGIYRAELPLAWQVLGVRVDCRTEGRSGDLALDVLLGGGPTLATALYVVDTRDGIEVPDFCDAHLGSTGCLHVFLVNPRSLEAQ